MTPKTPTTAMNRAIRQAGMLVALLGALLAGTAGAQPVDEAPVPDEAVATEPVEDVADRTADKAEEKVDRQSQRVQDKVEGRVDDETDQAVDRVLDKALDKLFGG